MLAIILTSALAASPAVEQGALSWSAPGAECPSAGEVVAELPPMEPGVEYDRFAATVSRTDRGWKAQVEGPESRELQADSCQELADAVVLLVELSMRQAEAAAVERRVEVTRGGSEPAEEERPNPAPDPEASTTPEVTVLAEPGAPEPGIAWGIAASGGAMFVVTPTAAGGFELLTGPRGRGWAVGLGAIGRPRFAGSDSGRDDVGSRFSIWSGLVRACGLPRRGRVEIPLCGGFELGAVSGIGTGNLAPAKRAVAPWIAGRLDVGVRVEAHPRVYPFAAFSGLVLPARPSFSIAGVGSVWEAPRAGLLATVGIELRIPAKKRRSGH